MEGEQRKNPLHGKKKKAWAMPAGRRKKTPAARSLVKTGRAKVGKGKTEGRS